jgi:Tfp pilus assembly protein PilF
MTDAFVEPSSSALSAELYSNLAAGYAQRGNRDSALACLRFALELDPYCLPALLNYGYLYFLDGEYVHAQRFFLNCLRLDSSCVRAWHLLALAQRGLGDLHQAINSFDTALLLDPTNAAALVDRGRLLLDLHRVDYAQCSFHSAIERDSADHRAWMGLSMCSFYLDQWVEGFNFYEHRLSFQGLLPIRPFGPLWSGEPVDHMLLVAEQGLGDTLMALRFLPFLRQHAATITLAVPPSLLSIASQVSELDAAVAVQEITPSIELPWLPCLSLPYRLRLSFPLSLPLPEIRISPERISFWRDQLRSRSEQPTLLVGVHWQGNPSFERNHLEGRSFSLDCLSPLTTVPGLQLVSLQKGFGSEQLDRCCFRDSFVAAQPQISSILDFHECAAIMANCDLIITSDSAVVHLAGLLQLPTWLMLHHTPDWRWGLHGSASALYPSVRLFRQSARGDWNCVVAELLQQLILEYGLTVSSDLRSLL